MHDILPLAISTAVIVLGVVFGILFNQRGLDRLEGRIDRLQSEMTQRFERMKSEMTQRFDRMQSDMSQFYSILGAHGEAIDTLKKR